MEIKAITRKWGNSIAVVIPKDVADKQQIHENQEIVITIENEKPKAGEFFGLLKNGFKETAQEIKDEARRGWESDTDRSR